MRHLAILAMFAASLAFAACTGSGGGSTQPVAGGPTAAPTSITGSPRNAASSWTTPQAAPMRPAWPATVPAPPPTPASEGTWSPPAAPAPEPAAPADAGGAGGGCGAGGKACG